MLVYKATELCIEAHKGQTRRDGKTPYYTHPVAVAELLDSPIAKVIALLHDVLEDTSISYQELLNRVQYITNDYGQTIVIMEALKALTHKKGTSYSSYIETVVGNQLAVLVKLADIAHNILDNPSENQVSKYGKAVKVLLRKAHEDPINW